MLLSVRHRFLFVHVAKTGGTSIRAALRPLIRRDPARIAQLLCSRLSAVGQHRLGVKLPRHAAAVAAKEMLPHGFFLELFKFSFVRNPWDLQVSAYFHLRRERPGLLAGISDFREYIRWKFDPERPYEYHLDVSGRPQLEYLRGLHGELLVDYVGRYERLAEDFDHVSRRIGIGPTALPHRRRARDRSPDYRRYYDDTSAELVASVYAPDLERFGYRF